MTQRAMACNIRECGIPAQIDPNVHRSVVSYARVALKKYADKPAIQILRADFDLR